jgi:hypothetical protein
MATPDFNKIGIVNIQTTKSLTTASQKLLDKNDRRKSAIITNSSDVGVWIKLGATAVIGEGFYIGPNGWSFELGPDLMWTGEVYGIAASGTGKVVGVFEGN